VLLIAYGPWVIGTEFLIQLVIKVAIFRTSGFDHLNWKINCRYRLFD